jgi:predicted metalloprotease with PDZ domain
MSRLLALVALLGCAPASRPGLEYTLRYRADGLEPTLAVELCVVGERRVASELKVPKPGTKTHLRIEHFRTVAGDRGQTCVAYELAGSGARDGAESACGYVDATSFCVFGDDALVMPSGDEKRAYAVSVRWGGGPPVATLASSFGISREERRRTTLGELGLSLFVGGDFRARDLHVRGRPVSLLVRGSWGFADAAFADLFARVLEVERAFWRDDAFPRFLGVLLPISGRDAWGGRGFTDAFMAYSAPDLELGLAARYLLAHEIFHTWNGRRIGRQEPERLVYWFSEGFTDYYANLLLLRTGLITLEEYVREYDDVLYAYFQSPERTAPNARVLADFDTNYAIEKLPYQRGRILAHEWNARIRARSRGAHSLDDVMRDLLAAARTQGAVVSAETLDRLARLYLPEGIAEDLRAHVDRGDLLDPRPDALGPCVRLERLPRAPFERGFDRRASEASGVIAGVKPGSNAERSGVRDGQALVELDPSNDPTRVTRVRVRDGAVERVIEYLPAAAPVVVPTYVLDTERLARDRSGCLAWFAAP